MKLFTSLSLFLGVLSLSYGQIDNPAPSNEASIDLPGTKFGISAHFGLGYRTGTALYKVDEFNKDFARKLDVGYTVQVIPTYYFSKSFGVGIMANAFQSKVTGDIMLDQNSNIYKGSTEKDMILYVGPAFTGRYSYHKYFWGFSVSGGYTKYISELSVTNNTTRVTAKADGFNWSAGTNFEFGYTVIDNLRVSLTGNYFYGRIFKFKVKDNFGNTEDLKLEGEDAEDVSRVGLGLGLNYSF